MGLLPNPIPSDSLERSRRLPRQKLKAEIGKLGKGPGLQIKPMNAVKDFLNRRKREQRGLSSLPSFAPVAVAFRGRPGWRILNP